MLAAFLQVGHGQACAARNENPGMWLQSRWCRHRRVLPEQPMQSGSSNRWCDRTVCGRTAYPTERGGKREVDDTLAHGSFPFESSSGFRSMIRYWNGRNMLSQPIHLGAERWQSESPSVCQMRRLWRGRLCTQTTECDRALSISLFHRLVRLLGPLDRFARLALPIFEDFPNVPLVAGRSGLHHKPINGRLRRRSCLVAGWAHCHTTQHSGVG